MSTEEPSYIDYESFIDPAFSAPLFANSLVLSTNDSSDTPLDLSTPLSRVLFDVQEIDTHIDTLTTKSALPLLNHTRVTTDASARILQDVDAQVATLADAYARLEREVIQRHAAAEEVRLVSTRLWQTVRIGRSVARCLMLGRQLDVQMAEVTQSSSGPKEDHRAMIRASNTLLSLRQLFLASGPGEEGERLDQINVITTLKNDLIAPAERTVKTRAQQIVREFSMSSTSVTPSSTNSTSSASTYSQTETTKSRATSALLTLYLLSPTPHHAADFTPNLLLASLQTYLQTAHTSSLASLSRALSTLPQLDRALLETSARCQNIVGLSALLSNIKYPAHPLLPASAAPASLLEPLLAALDASTLASHFWRQLAGALSGRVADIMAKGGVSARTLRSNRDRVSQAVRECVIRGCVPPRDLGPGAEKSKVGWEREAAVMIGSIVGGIGR